MQARILSVNKWRKQLSRSDTRDYCTFVVAIFMLSFRVMPFHTIVNSIGVRNIIVSLHSI